MRKLNLVFWFWTFICAWAMHWVWKIALACGFLQVPVQEQAVFAHPVHALSYEPVGFKHFAECPANANPVVVIRTPLNYFQVVSVLAPYFGQDLMDIKMLGNEDGKASTLYVLVRGNRNYDAYEFPNVPCYIARPKPSLVARR